MPKRPAPLESLTQSSTLSDHATEFDVKRRDLRVLVADSTPLTGHLIADSLKRDRTLAVTVVKGNSITTMATSLKPHVVILSEHLEGISGRGFEVLAGLRAAVPSVRVVMLVDSAHRELVVRAFRQGARGIFCRCDPLGLLSRCVHRVHEGHLWISGAQLEYLLEALAAAPRTRLIDTQGTVLLSKREQDIMRWLAAGYSNRAIARELNVSQNTVKNHLFRIFNKLGVSSRVEAVIYAATQRWAA
jgi:two-component system, NarL family, nitrate/nitrite response regulator NarL